MPVPISRATDFRRHEDFAGLVKDSVVLILRSLNMAKTDSLQGSLDLLVPKILLRRPGLHLRHHVRRQGLVGGRRRRAGLDQAGPSRPHVRTQAHVGFCFPASN